MRWSREWLLLIVLWAQASMACAVSNAPLLALNAYIEQTSSCSEKLVEWNRVYNAETIAGTTARSFYYRVIGFQEWGVCGRPFFPIIFSELQKASFMFSEGLVSDAEFEAKELELINLFFAALKDQKQGAAMVRLYQSNIAARLLDLDPPRQAFNCTFFGDQPRCME